MDGKFKIGISSCLLGNEVRWNAGHKKDKYLTNILGQFVDYVPVCPEVEIGLGIPPGPGCHHQRFYCQLDGYHQ